MYCIHYMCIICVYNILYMHYIIYYILYNKYNVYTKPKERWSSYIIIIFLKTHFRTRNIVRD